MRVSNLAVLALAAVCASAAADTYTVTFDRSVRDTPATGRLMLFFITETGPAWERQRPIDAPFYEAPQPIASVAVENLKPGEVIVLDGSAIAFPMPLNELHGTARVQALLDLHDNPQRSHTSGPGNLYSDIITVELSRDRDDSHHLILSNVVRPRPLPAEQSNLKWIEFRSDLLSEFYGRDVYHRAGVALPLPYLDEDHPRQQWPAIYVIPGYGGRHEAALTYASMFRTHGIEEIAPMAVSIVLDPESPLGHHGFVDSPNNGPRGTALVTEFIPHLEQLFRLAPEPEGRIVTGHSSGGWTSLWLQLNWPDVFGACFSSAPDPIDFSAFQVSNLYEDENVYVRADGSETPSYRMIRGLDEEFVLMTVRAECLMEHAMHPLGGSGQQWDAWMAMFSPRDEKTGFPKRMYDPLTGKIERNVVRHWEQFDITRMVRDDWDRYGPIITQRVRLACGMLDHFYLERAVVRFKAMVQQQAGDHAGPGYILLHETADHYNLMAHIYQRWNREMREHLRSHGLHD